MTDFFLNGMIAFLVLAGQYGSLGKLFKELMKDDVFSCGGAYKGR